jgi:hypothetical protein
VLLFITADEARSIFLKGIYKWGCRFSERLKAKAGGGESLTHTMRLPFTPFKKLHVQEYKYD